MKITFEIELGNDAMQSRFDVYRAIQNSLLRLDGPARLAPLEDRESAQILDGNGNIVGNWTVSGE